MNLFIIKVCRLVVLCILANSALANISIPFELKNGLIIVEAEINGSKGNYIVDSGSNGILLNGASNKSDISYQTLNSSLEGSETKIESFKVGDFEASKLLGFSTDLSNLEIYLDKSIAGILGCSIFTPSSLVFDFENSKLLISDRIPDVNEIKNLTKLTFNIIEDLPITEINIDGIEYAFILDSGASSHFFDFTSHDKGQHDFELTGIEKDIITAGGEAQVSLEYSISNCKIGSSISSIKAFEKDFSLISETLGKNVSGLLSLSTLSTGKVFFDLNSNALYFN